MIDDEDFREILSTIKQKAKEDTFAELRAIGFNGDLGTAYEVGVDDGKINFARNLLSDIEQAMRRYKKIGKMVPTEVAIDDCPRLKAALDKKRQDEDEEFCQRMNNADLTALIAIL